MRVKEEKSGKSTLSPVVRKMYFRVKRKTSMEDERVNTQ